MRIEHRYFGTLNIPASAQSDVIWEGHFSLHDVAFEVWLWVTPGTELTLPMLDAFAARLQDLPALDRYARQQLVHYLTHDRFYITDHIEQLSETPLVEALAPHGDAERVDVEAFVTAMTLTGIGLWSGHADAPVVMDYIFDPASSDEILVVNLTAEGRLVDIAWES